MLGKEELETARKCEGSHQIQHNDLNAAKEHLEGVRKREGSQKNHCLF